MADFDTADIIECANLAPSVHNTQPWSFVATESRLELFADGGRRLDYLDPTGRQLHVSCGAAIEFAYLAIRAAGRQCDVHPLPDPARPDLLASLQIGAEQRPTSRETALAEAIFRRYTDRGPYSDRAVPPALLVDVQTRCAELGVWVRILDNSADRAIVATILTDAEAQEAADTDYARELSQWTTVQPQDRGLPVDAAPAWPQDVVSDVPLRDFAGHAEHRHAGGIETPPRVERDTLLLLGTPHDDRDAWLASGRALGWLLLRATIDCASAQPLGPSIDVPDSRARLRRELGLVGQPQFLLRVGFGSGQPRTRRDRAQMSQPLA